MSEVIVRMEMPTRCGACKCRHVEFDIDRVAVFCAIMDNLFVEDPDSIPSWCPIKGVLPEQHGPLVDFNDVSKELRKYGYIVKDETTGMQYMEYPIVLEQNPIRIPTIVPATERSKT